MKTWWLNNSWRFWQFQWAWAEDWCQAFEVWKEYRYMLNPEDERCLTDLILEDYEKDTDKAWSNPLVRLVFWIRRAL